ncbi:MAG: hypothetical protein ABI670_22070 [Chloroflexota bacterium]
MSKKLQVALTDTLMAWAGEFHVPSGERLSTYYLSVPDSWASLSQAQLKANVFEAFQAIYAGFNAHFRAVEPDDLAYLTPLDVKPSILTADEEQAAPWLQAHVPAVWEWTPCVVVDEAGAYTKVDPVDF